MVRHEEGTLQRALSEFGDKQYILLTEVSDLQPTKKTSRAEQCLRSSHDSGQCQVKPVAFQLTQQSSPPLMAGSAVWSVLTQAAWLPVGFLYYHTSSLPISIPPKEGMQNNSTTLHMSFTCQKWLKQASITFFFPKKEEPKDFIFSLKWLILASFILNAIADI